MSNSDWVPTARLRFVKREIPGVEGGVPAYTLRILQQYWAQDVPGYMRKSAEGGWRDVEIEEETAP
jgi:hypothetical protein